MRPREWREEFIAAMARNGQNVEVSRAILRVVATMNRLAEAECNGDWPCDNGERPVVQCQDCQSGYVKSAVRKDGRCVNCHAQDKAKRLVPEGWSAEFQGDPRGCVMTLVAPQGQRIGVP